MDNIVVPCFFDSQCIWFKLRFRSGKNALATDKSDKKNRAQI